MCIWEKVISILAGNLNSGLGYFTTTVMKTPCKKITIKPDIISSKFTLCYAASAAASSRSKGLPQSASNMASAISAETLVMSRTSSHGMFIMSVNTEKVLKSVCLFTSGTV